VSPTGIWRHFGFTVMEPAHGQRDGVAVQRAERANTTPLQREGEAYPIFDLSELGARQTSCSFSQELLVQRHDLRDIDD